MKHIMDTKDIRDIGDYKKYQRTMNIHDSKNIEDIKNNRDAKDIRVSNDIRETDYRGYQEKKPHEGGHYHEYHGKQGYLVVLRITDISNSHPNTTLVVLGYHWSPV